MLKATSEEVRITFQMLRCREGVRDASVEEVELRRTNGLPLFGLCPGREKEADKGMLE